MRKIIIIEFILSALLFINCQNRSEDELDSLNSILDSMIIMQYDNYNIIQKNKMGVEYVDSIYSQGNKLISSIGNGNFNTMYFDFCEQYGIQHIIKDENNENSKYLKIKIKLCILDALNQQIQSFYKSHFQVDLIGLQPINNEVYQNENTTLKLIPSYLSSVENIQPMFIIENDTLPFDGTYYNYNFIPHAKGEHVINAQVITYRWGDTLKGNCGFKINVK